MKNPKKVARDRHNKMISQNIKRTWVSLDTHLGYAYGTPYRRGETNAFHIKSILDYCEMMLAFAKSYRKK